MPAPLLKPSKLEREMAKHEKRQAREKSKAAEARKEARAWSAIVRKVWERDDAACRACHRMVFQYAGMPETKGHVHHIAYRSAGGNDTTANCVLLCAKCHELEHVHMISITGHGDGQIVVTRRSA